jgi:hypothetical protein
VRVSSRSNEGQLSEYRNLSDFVTWIDWAWRGIATGAEPPSALTTRAMSDLLLSVNEPLILTRDSAIPIPILYVDQSRH